MTLLQWTGQGLTWALVAAAIAALAQGPDFQPYPTGRALIKFSLAHLPQRLEPCRELTAEERAELPPTRRVQEVCERGRAPTRFELSLDGEILAQATIEPAGLSDDGRSYFLEYYSVDPGEYRATVQLSDTAETDGYSLSRAVPIQLEAGQVALIEVGDDDITFEAPQQQGRAPWIIPTGN